jgi:hypothetical protein
MWIDTLTEERRKETWYVLVRIEFGSLLHSTVSFLRSNIVKAFLFFMAVFGPGKTADVDIISASIVLNKV